MSSKSLLKYLVQGYKVSFCSITKHIQLHAPTICSPMKGYYDMEFYRLQEKYIQKMIKSNQSFQWKHPTKILEDIDRYIWYQNGTDEEPIVWRPAMHNMMSEYNLDEISYILYGINKQIKKGTIYTEQYPCCEITKRV